MADGRFQNPYPIIAVDTDGMLIGTGGRTPPCGLPDCMVVVGFNEEQARQTKHRKGNI
jgi:hypothetical protein